MNIGEFLAVINSAFLAGWAAMYGVSKIVDFFSDLA